MDDRLSLLICGTQVSSDGFQELVHIGLTPKKDDVDEGYDKQFSASECYVECKHCREFIRYSMVLNPGKVRSADSPRDGRLSIVVTIVRNVRLDGGRSPFDLLMAIWEKFRTECMTLGYNGKYMFNPGKYSQEAFDYILKNYPTIPYPGKYVEMVGVEPACLVLPSEVMMGQLLNDTQYSELSAYSCLRVATKGIVLRPISLEIPRKQRFSVFVNGNKRGEVSPNDRFKLTVNPAEPQFYKETVLDFSLAELRQKKIVSGCNYSVDESREEIRCSVSFAPKCFRRKIRFEIDGVANDAMPAAEVSQFVLKKKTDGSASSVKKITKDANNELFVEFCGREVADSWQCVYSGKKYKAPEYIHNSDTSTLEAIDTIRLSREPVIRGFRIENLPNELQKSKVSIICELNYQQPCKKTFDLAHERCCSFGDVFNDISRESVRRAVITFDGYEPLTVLAASLRPDGEWLGIDAGGLRKKTQPVENNRPEVQNPKQRCLLIEEIDRVDSKCGSIEVSVYFKLHGKTCSNVRYLPEDANSLRIDLPSQADPQKVLFRSEKIENCKVEQINLTDNTYRISVPNFQPCSRWRRFQKIADRLQLFEKTMIFIIGLALGVAGCYFISNFVEIKTDSKASELIDPPATPTEQSPCPQGLVGDPANNGGQAAGKAQVETPQSEQTRAQSCPPGVQKEIDNYFEKMKKAEVSLDEVDAISVYVNSEQSKNAKNINDVKLMAECYKLAAPIVIKIRDRQIKSADDAKAEFNAVNTKASKYKKNGTIDILYNFRNSIQTLYLPTAQNANAYHRAVYGNSDSVDVLASDTPSPIKDVTSFKELLEAKKKFDEQMNKK